MGSIFKIACNRKGAMLNQRKIEMSERKQLRIFLSVAFVLPYLMGILMGYAYNRGIDVSFFPNAQMYYPAAGIMLGILVAKKEDGLVPRRFYFFFITITAVILLMTIASAFVSKPGFIAFLNLVIIIGSAASWIILLAEKKEKRDAYGLRAHNGKMSALMVLLFLALYFGRILLSYLAGGQMNEFAKIFQNPRFYSMILILPFNFFLVFTAFFGEEYGWRYYFTPFLQKHFGKVRGVHLPINIFYYSPETWLQSILSQQITCIGMGIFFSYTYLKTNNIWVPVILHYLNNNLIAVLNSGNADVINNQLISWKDVLLLLIFNLVLFVPFIFAKEFREPEKKDNSL